MSMGPPARLDLRGRDLRGENLHALDLRAARLAGAVLAGCDLDGLDLTGADLSGADLTGASLSGTNLSRAILVGARHAGARFSGALLHLTAIEAAYASVLSGYAGTPDWGGRGAAQPRRYATAYGTVRCSHCAQEDFLAHHVVAGGRGLAILDMEWAGTGMSALECASCSRLEWFRRCPDPE